MALSKAKQQVIAQFSTVLENLDDKNALDQNILKAAHALFKALVDASAAQGDEAEGEIEAGAEDEIEVDGDETEVAGDDDDVSFDEEGEEGEAEEDASDDEEVAGDDDDVSFGDDEEVEADGDDDVSFDDEEAEAPAKPARKPAAAAVEEVEAVDYDSMKAQDLYNHLIEALPSGRSVDPVYAKKIATTTKKEGLVKLVKNIDKLQAIWLKNPNFKKPVETIEKLVVKLGATKPSYGRGKSSDEKKKRILAGALAGALKKPA